MTATALHETRYRGAIVGLDGTLLHGWALDRQDPDARLILEIWIDGAWVATARADRFQAEPPEGDGFHGFSAPLPDRWIAQARRLAARIANRAAWLPGSLTLPQALDDRRQAPAASQVWSTGGLTVTGWAWDPRDPERHLTIGARLAERPLASALADRPHPALIDLPRADHGFVLELPWSLADGATHEIHLESELGVPLNGSPLLIRQRPEGLEHLIRRYWPASADPAARDALPLLLGLARDQDRRAPRTLGLVHYGHWQRLWRRDELPPLGDPPLKIGVLVLAGADADEDARQRTAASVAAQTHPAWQVVQAPPHRLRAAMTLLLAQGAEAILPIVAGDSLTPEALQALAPALRDDPAAQRPAAAWAYADCDREGAAGEPDAPWFKPVWDPDLFMGIDLFSPGALFGAALLREALALPMPASPPAPAAADHGLLAAVALVTERQGARVAHVPLPLYRRRASQPACPSTAPADPARLHAIAWLADRRIPGARVTPLEAFPALYRVQWPLPAPLPLVSLIVPTRDRLDLLRPCIESLLHGTDYPHLEILVVDNDSHHPDTLAYLDALRMRCVRVLVDRRAFNYAAINNRAAHQARGALIGLINNDLEARDPGWLKEMVSQLARPGVGAVGAKLLWPNGMVQHGGVVVGINGLAAHTGNGWSEGDAGYLGINQVARRQSAVTAACLLLPRALYWELGGLNARDFPVAFNDVDLCLRILRSGRQIVWTPFVRLLHAESASRGKDDRPERTARAALEQQNLLRRWRHLPADPYYHPALTHDWSAGPYGGLQGLATGYTIRLSPPWPP